MMSSSSSQRREGPDGFWRPRSKAIFRETYFVTNFFRFHVNGRRSEADQFQLMAPSPTLEDRVDDQLASPVVGSRA